METSSALNRMVIRNLDAFLQMKSAVESCDPLLKTTLNHCVIRYVQGVRGWKCTCSSLDILIFPADGPEPGRISYQLIWPGDDSYWMAHATALDGRRLAWALQLSDAVTKKRPLGELLSTLEAMPEGSEILTFDREERLAFPFTVSAEALADSFPDFSRALEGPVAASLDALMRAHSALDAWAKELAGA